MVYIYLHICMYAHSLSSNCHLLLFKYIQPSYYNKHSLSLPNKTKKKKTKNQTNHCVVCTQSLHHPHARIRIHHRRNTVKNAKSGLDDLRTPYDGMRIALVCGTIKALSTLAAIRKMW